MRKYILHLLLIATAACLGMGCLYFSGLDSHVSSKISTYKEGTVEEQVEMQEYQDKIKSATESEAQLKKELEENKTKNQQLKKELPILDKQVTSIQNVAKEGEKYKDTMDLAALIEATNTLTEFKPLGKDSAGVKESIQKLADKGEDK